MNGHARKECGAGVGEMVRGRGESCARAGEVVHARAVDACVDEEDHGVSQDGPDREGHRCTGPHLCMPLLPAQPIGHIVLAVTDMYTETRVQYMHSLSK